MIVEPKREILLGPLLRAGVQRSWAAREQLLRLGIVPLVAIVVILVPLHSIAMTLVTDTRANLVADQDQVLQFVLLSLCYAVVLNVFAVNWLRQLTLGSTAVPGLGLGLASRHVRFLMLILGASLVTGILGLILMLVLSPLDLPGAMAALMASVLLWTAFLVRLSPSWIGIALDAPMPIRIAWRRTAGQGFKLLVAVLAVEVPLMLAEQLLGGIFEGTGLLALAPLTFVLLTAALQLIGTAVQLAILVTAFPHFLRETV